MARAWYVFIGGDDPMSASRYIKVQSKPKCLCGNIICSIYAIDNGLHPQDPLSENLRNYIKRALATEMLQPEYPFDSKKYVYLR